MSRPPVFTLIAGVGLALQWNRPRQVHLNHWYNAGRLHQALSYRSPRQFRALLPQLVA